MSVSARRRRLLSWSASCAAFALWVDAMRHAAASSAADGARPAPVAPCSDPRRSARSSQAGSVRSVNDGLCDLVGSRPRSCSGHARHYRSGRPSTPTRSRSWLASSTNGESTEGELTLRHRDGRRLRVLVSGRTLVGGDASRHLITVRDASAGHERERRLLEVATRDVDTGLLDRAEFERRLGDAVRRAIVDGSQRGPRPRGARSGRPRGRLGLRQPGRDSRRRPPARAPSRGRRAGPYGRLRACDDSSGHRRTRRRRRRRTGPCRSRRRSTGVTLTAGICDLEPPQEMRSRSMPTRIVRLRRLDVRGSGEPCSTRPRSRQPRSLTCGAGPPRRPWRFRPLLRVVRGAGSFTACSSERQAVCPSFAGTVASPCCSGRLPARRSARTSRRSHCPSTCTTRPAPAAGSPRS